MHRPGIEPGSKRWQRSILPLNHRCFVIDKGKIYLNKVDLEERVYYLFILTYQISLIRTILYNISKSNRPN